jgi:hypothetical protein
MVYELAHRLIGLLFTPDLRVFQLNWKRVSRSLHANILAQLVQVMLQVDIRVCFVFNAVFTQSDRY